jgi:hypothetical protein
MPAGWSSPHGLCSLGNGQAEGIVKKLWLVQRFHDPLSEFGFRSHPDARQDGARHLREEALDQVEPAAMLWREHEAKAAVALCGEPVLVSFDTCAE